MMSEILGDIEMTRGDSYPLTLTVKSKSTGLPIDLTGYAFLLTVNSEKDPTDITHQIFQVIGIVDIDQVANKGKVAFTPTSANTVTVGKFYYDIQWTVGSIIRSWNEKKKFTIKQDITK
jgi:hypothetical protein